MQLMSVLRAEQSNEVVLRLQEMSGSDSRVTLRLGEGIGSAREVDGCERERGRAQVEDGGLHTRLRAFQPKSFALRMTPPMRRIPPLRTTSVPLQFDTEALSFHSQSSGCDFDGRGHSIPGELFPAELMSGEIPFRLAAAAAGEPHCVSCRGQELALPGNDFDRLFLLVASVGPEASSTFDASDSGRSGRVHNWSRPIGKWRRQRYILGRPWGEATSGYLVRTPVAWIATHRHDRRVRDQAYRFCYLFRYSVPLTPGAGLFRLPDDPNVKVFAATVARIDATELIAAHDLFG